MKGWLRMTRLLILDVFERNFRKSQKLGLFDYYTSKIFAKLESLIKFRNT